MTLEIADLHIELSMAGGLPPRCRGYLCEDGKHILPDIIIREDMFRPNAWGSLTGDDYIYMETGSHFYAQLLNFNGLMLHASAVELGGKAYLFSGPCGMGKSTHTRLWKQTFGEAVRVFNDDKPALRYLDGRWFAYGTPWCGKDGININMKAPLAGICFLKQASENRIRRLCIQEAMTKTVSQTLRRFAKEESLTLMLSHVDKLVREVPFFELENRPEAAAARLSYEAMKEAAQEAGL